MGLPIDSHPWAIYNLTGAAWRSRIQVGVDVPDTNSRIRVLSTNGTSMTIRIGVG